MVSVIKSDLSRDLCSFFFRDPGDIKFIALFLYVLMHQLDRYRFIVVWSDVHALYAEPFIIMKELLGENKKIANDNREVYKKDGVLMVNVMGAPGAGKTTAFNCITGVYEPTNGRVLFMGKPMVENIPQGKMKKQYLKKKIVG